MCQTLTPMRVLTKSTEETYKEFKKEKNVLVYKQVYLIYPTNKAPLLKHKMKFFNKRKQKKTGKLCLPTKEMKKKI